MLTFTLNFLNKLHKNKTNIWTLKNQNLDINNRIQHRKNDLAFFF